MKRATEKEKAIIFAFAAGFIPSWKEAYILSRETPTESVNSLATVTRWKQREDIRNAYNYAIAFLSKRDEEIKEKALREASKGEPETPGDNVSTKTRQASKLDYYDPANQRKTINAIIEAAKDDPKTQLDAIKAIQQTQRDDRQAAKDQQTQRIYSPLRCYDCPLHAKALKDSEKRTK